MSIQIQGTVVVDASRNLANIASANISGNVTLSGGVITGLGTPVNGTDAANKSYADAAAGTKIVCCTNPSGQVNLCLCCANYFCIDATAGNPFYICIMGNSSSVSNFYLNVTNPTCLFNASCDTLIKDRVSHIVACDNPYQLPRPYSALYRAQKTIDGCCYELYVDDFVYAGNTSIENTIIIPSRCDVVACQFSCFSGGVSPSIVGNRLYNRWATKPTLTFKDQLSITNSCLQYYYGSSDWCRCYCCNFFCISSTATAGLPTQIANRYTNILNSGCIPFTPNTNCFIGFCCICITTPSSHYFSLTNKLEVVANVSFTGANVNSNCFCYFWCSGCHFICATAPTVVANFEKPIYSCVQIRNQQYFAFIPSCCALHIPCFGTAFYKCNCFNCGCMFSATWRPKTAPACGSYVMGCIPYFVIDTVNNCCVSTHIPVCSWFLCGCGACANVFTASCGIDSSLQYTYAILGQEPSLTYSSPIRNHLTGLLSRPAGAPASSFIGHGFCNGSNCLFTGSSICCFAYSRFLAYADIATGECCAFTVVNNNIGMCSTAWTQFGRLSNTNFFFLNAVRGFSGSGPAFDCIYIVRKLFPLCDNGFINACSPVGGPACANSCFNGVCISPGNVCDGVAKMNGGLWLEPIIYCIEGNICSACVSRSCLANSVFWLQRSNTATGACNGLDVCCNLFSFFSCSPSGQVQVYDGIYNSSSCCMRQTSAVVYAGQINQCNIAIGIRCWCSTPCAGAVPGCLAYYHIAKIFNWCSNNNTWSETYCCRTTGCSLDTCDGFFLGCDLLRWTFCGYNYCLTPTYAEAVMAHRIAQCSNASTGIYEPTSDFTDPWQCTKSCWAEGFKAVISLSPFWPLNGYIPYFHGEQSCHPIPSYMFVWNAQRCAVVNNVFNTL